MAEIKQTLERIYTIPLKDSWMKVPRYKRARKAVVAIKEFIAKHMKVANRDIDNVKLDIDFNNQIWFRGSRNAPSKVKVKAVREGGIVKVSFAEIPQHITFLQAKRERLHKKTDKKVEARPEEKKETKTEEEKKEETEKEKAAATQKEQIAGQHVKEHKHTTKTKETQIHRMALKK